MQIIEVIPLTTLPPQVPQILSYFFIKALLKGAVVEISLNNRKVPAVVASSTSLEEEKISLKKSGFQLKKISTVISEVPLVSNEQFKIALWLAKNYFAPLGLCLKTVLPPFFLKKKQEIRDKEQEIKSEILNKPLILLSRAKDIIKNIEPEIKKVLNKKKQVLIVVPEISVAQYFYEYFAGYYETALIHSKIPPGQYYKSWNKISSGETEVIIGTRQALFAPFSNLGLVIVEDPKNEAYKSDMSPKYNTADLARKIAEIYSCPITFVSQIPDIRSYQLSKNETYRIEDKTASVSAKVGVIDMVQEIKNGNFSTLSNNLANRIIEYTKEGKKILIFSSRKGYSGSLLCENCGFTFKCPNCSIPLRLYNKSESILACHRCSAIQKIPECCPNCRSYKLRTAGLPGSQKLEEDLAWILKNHQIKTPIFILDSSHIKTAKAEQDIIKQMESHESYICIATQMIFSHRYSQKFDFIGIPSADSLTTIPDYRAEEGLFNQFEKLLDFEPEEIVIQTYNPDNSLYSLLASFNYKDFYEKEMPVRKLFWYPPFARLIKLSFRHGNLSKAAYEARILGEKLKMAIVQRKMDKTVKLLGPSPAFIEKERGLYAYHIILKILPEQRPDEVLRFVPSNWMIDVDPRSIL